MKYVEARRRRVDASIASTFYQVVERVNEYPNSRFSTYVVALLIHDDPGIKREYIWRTRCSESPSALTL